MEVLQGKIERIIFHNNDNGYTVFLLKVKNPQLYPKSCYRVNGTFFDVKENDKLTLSGSFQHVKKYGLTFIVDSFEYDIPKRPDLLEKYLCSGEFKGIGKDKAKKIVDKFGEDTLYVLQNEPKRLTEVEGIGKKTANYLGNKFNKQSELQKTIISLTNFGIAPALGVKIYETYLDNTLSIIQKNPYRLIEDIKGIGFLMADKIALSCGVSKHSEFRIHAGIIYALEKNNEKGNMYCPVDMLKKLACDILNVTSVDEVFKKMLEERSLVLVDDFKVYSLRDYKTELKLSKNIKRISKFQSKNKVDENTLARETKRLNKKQIEGVRSAIKHGLTVITGGPGTGKSTTLKAIINYFESINYDVALAAPTGKAAKRMQEVSGKEAKTIHRLLEVFVTDDEITFLRNENNTLECDVLLIDETSMMDSYLANSLFKAIETGTHVVLLGDYNQLPSVDSGNVLEDIINACICPIIELTQVYRQSEDSHIISNANAILKGEELNLTNLSKDFFFKSCDDPRRMQEMIMHYAIDSLPAFTNEKEVQILAPVKDGPLGVNELNRLMQNKLLPNAKELYGFRVGDKVMQTENDYTRIKTKNGKIITGVFNGDSGVVKSIDFNTREITVEFFDGGVSIYGSKEIRTLTLSYALTIHKSQGAEYSVVVIPVYNYIPQLTSRNLIYTGITRAKKAILLVGSRQKLYGMINNTDVVKRYTSLSEMCRAD